MDDRTRCTRRIIILAYSASLLVDGGHQEMGFKMSELQGPILDPNPARKRQQSRPDLLPTCCDSSRIESTRVNSIGSVALHGQSHQPSTLHATCTATI